MKKSTCQKFKETLEARLETLQNHIHTATTSILELNDQHHGDQADLVSVNSQGAIDNSLINQYQQELVEIQKSLDKICNGNFGICEMCGDEIDEKRLWVKPHAKFCIVCREIYEKTSKEQG